MRGRILTLGYEGLSPDQFLASARAAGVKVIVDVRATPISRKKGFSKSALCDFLSEHGIGYVHVPNLGCPKSIRDKYKLDKDWRRYTRSFNEYLATQGEAKTSLAKLARKQVCCLICFEADFNFCHRTYVGRDVAKMAGLDLAHIFKGIVTPDAVRLAA